MLRPAAQWSAKGRELLGIPSHWRAVVSADLRGRGKACVTRRVLRGPGSLSRGADLAARCRSGRWDAEGRVGSGLARRAKGPLPMSARHVGRGRSTAPSVPGVWPRRTWTARPATCRLASCVSVAGGVSRSGNARAPAATHAESERSAHYPNCSTTWTTFTPAWSWAGSRYSGRAKLGQRSPRSRRSRISPSSSGGTLGAWPEGSSPRTARRDRNFGYATIRWHQRPAIAEIRLPPSHLTHGTLTANAGPARPPFPTGPTRSPQPGRGRSLRHQLPPWTRTVGTWTCPGRPGRPSRHPSPSCVTSRWRTVDVNGGHLVVCLLDVSGNPMGSPITLALQLRGSPPAARNGGGEQPAHSYRKRHHCTAVVIEEMDIAAAQILRRRIFFVIAVDPAYIFRWRV